MDKASEAIEFLQTALQNSEGYKEQVQNDPVFKSLQDNPEFQKLLEEDEPPASS